MSHDAERDAAAYLGGAMSSRQARRFEAHLVDCEECWREVSEGRHGRHLAESGRDLAPAGLREDLRAALRTTPQRSPSRVIAVTMGAAALLAVAVTALALTLWPSRQPGPIAEAVSDYRGARLAVSGPSARPAPELTGTGLGLVAEGGGGVGTLDVDAFVARRPRTPNPALSERSPVPGRGGGPPLGPARGPLDRIRLGRAPAVRQPPGVVAGALGRCRSAAPGCVGPRRPVRAGLSAASRGLPASARQCVRECTSETTP